MFGKGEAAEDSAPHWLRRHLFLKGTGQKDWASANKPRPTDRSEAIAMEFKQQSSKRTTKSPAAARLQAKMPWAMAVKARSVLRLAAWPSARAAQNGSAMAWHSACINGKIALLSPKEIGTKPWPKAMRKKT